MWGALQAHAPCGTSIFSTLGYSLLEQHLRGCPNCVEARHDNVPYGPLSCRCEARCHRCTVWQLPWACTQNSGWPCRSGAVARSHRPFLQTCSPGGGGSSSRDGAIAAPHRGTARTASEQNEKPLYKHQHKECTACERTKHEFAHNLIAMHTHPAKTGLDRRAGSSMANSVM